MRAWIIVYISFQLWTEFGGKFINQVKASPVKEFENDINFKKSESNTFLHWQKNLAICSLANTVL
jgi:predicted RNA-binding protein